MPSVIFYPAVSGDDTRGPYSFSSSTDCVTIGHDNSASMTITCRFPKFTISPGSTITSAKLHAFEFAERSGNVLSNIYCNDIDNAIAPTTEPELTALVKTTAHVAWNAVSAVDGEFISPDISSVIQEIIDRDGWKSGNAIQIIWADNGSERYSYRMISAIDYDSGSAKMELHIEWTAGTGVSEDGHLLIEATINNKLYRVSTDSVALEHSWDPHVISFDAPNLDSTAAYGGFCKVTFGSISFNPILFDDEWFPPDKISLAIKYTETNEAEAKDVFSATAYLSKVMDSEITYDVRDFEYNKTVLDECIDVDGNIDVPVPYVIGSVSHALPVIDDTTCYRINGIDLTNPEAQIKLISMYDASYTKIETFSAHGFSNADAYTVALFHFNGGDGSTIFINGVGNYGFARGDAQLDTEQKKFGTASGLFSGDIGCYVEFVDFVDFDFGTGDFTIDFWFITKDIEWSGVIANQVLLCCKHQFYTFAAIGIQRYGNSILLYMSSNGTSYDIANGESFGTISADEWHHLTLAREGSNIRLFLDGSLNDTILSSASVDFVQGYIGGHPDFLGLYGYIDEFRISKGIARWTENFTPPTSEYQGTSIIVSDTRDFNGTYTVSSVTSTTFLIEKAFNSGVPLYQIASFEDFPIITDFVNADFDDWSV